MSGVDKIELPQFSIVDYKLISKNVVFSTGLQESPCPCSMYGFVELKKGAFSIDDKHGNIKIHKHTLGVRY